MKYKPLSMSIIKITAVILLVIIAIIFLYNSSIPTSKQSSFKGNAEFFNFTAINSNMQFKAKGIYFLTNDTMFYSLKNITIESNDGKTRLINYSNSLQVQYNEKFFQPLQNVDVGILFKNLTLAKELDYNRINLFGYMNINAPNKLKSTGGEVFILKDSVNYVFIGDEKFTDFRRISFEMDNTSSVQFFSETIKLEAFSASDLKITSQLSKIILYQGEGVFGLNNHIFDVRSSDVLNVEILAGYKESSLLRIDDTKILFTGVTNSAELNNENLIMDDFDYWLKIQPEKINAYSSAINAVVAVVLVVLTFFNVRSTQRLVLMEAEKKKHEKQRFLNILLSELEINNQLLGDLKKSVDTISKDPSKLIEFVFFGFKEDGFNTFRNRGGFEYVDSRLYNKIVDYYTSLYRLDAKNKLKLSIETNQLGRILYHATQGTLIKDIESIIEFNNNLKNELKSEIQRIEN